MLNYVDFLAKGSRKGRYLTGKLVGSYLNMQQEVQQMDFTDHVCVIKSEIQLIVVVLVTRKIKTTFV